MTICITRYFIHTTPTKTGSPWTSATSRPSPWNCPFSSLLVPSDPLLCFLRQQWWQRNQRRWCPEYFLLCTIASPFSFMYQFANQANVNVSKESSFLLIPTLLQALKWDSVGASVSLFLLLLLALLLLHRRLRVSLDGGPRSLLGGAGILLDNALI